MNDLVQLIEFKLSNKPGIQLLRFPYTGNIANNEHEQLKIENDKIYLINLIRNKIKVPDKVKITLVSWKVRDSNKKAKALKNPQRINQYEKSIFKSKNENK